MSAERAISEHHRGNRNLTSDTAQFVSDEAFVAGAKMGNESVFDELHERHRERMFRVAHRITRNREDAQDAVQESFLSAYVHLKRFEGRARFSTWLTRITINAALMKVRKTRRSREVSVENFAETSESLPINRLVDSSPNPEQTFARVEREANLKNAIAKLRPGLRRAVDIYLLQECSMDETAKALGISIGAAKARLFHARAALRRTAELKARRRIELMRSSFRTRG